METCVEAFTDDSVKAETIIRFGGRHFVMDIDSDAAPAAIIQL